MIDLTKTEDEPTPQSGVEAELRFPLPEFQAEFKAAIYGQDYLGTLIAIDQMMRNHLKYGDQFNSPDEVCRWVREEIRELTHTEF